MQRIALFCTATALAAALSTAQSTMIVPPVAATADGNSSSGWPFDIGAIRIQYILDSTNVTLNGVNYPIVISGIKVRANGSTANWVGDTIASLQVNLSTSPIDYTAITNTYASNHGADLTQVYNAPLTIAAGNSTTGNPGPFHVVIPFSTPFRYDPNQGDLTIEYVSSGVPSTANTPTIDAVTTVGIALSKRLYTLTNLTQATGTIFSGEIANVLELSYVPASGLFAGFTATPTTGPSPLNVSFTSTSFSSDPGGVTSYAWDFDGDSVIDSTLQNPSFIYNTCGSFSVSLTVTDGAHAPNTLTRPSFVVTDDDVTPSFTFAPLSPNSYQFTDTTTPAATSWAWDFNGDNIVDSTAQNPVWAFPGGCIGADVQLTVNRLCRGPFSTSRQFVVGATALQTTLAGGNGTSSSAWVGNLFDVSVTNPFGISVCALTLAPYTFTGPFDVRVYVTPDTYVGKDTNIAAWRLISTGAGTASGGTSTTRVPTIASVTPFYLAPGNYGLSVWIDNPAGTANLSYTDGPLGPFANADVTLFPAGGGPGGARTALFAGSLNSPRVWNGELHYSTCGTSGMAGFGFFGPGCAGTLGVASQVSQNRPVLGSTLNVDVNNLPVNGAVMALGLSRTTSPFGPLPLDLTAFGAPGCEARVNPEATFFLTGANNSATWSFALPNTPAFACIPFFTQAVVLDPTANAFGAVLSDAAAAITGTN